MHQATVTAGHSVVALWLKPLAVLLHVVSHCFAPQTRQDLCLIGCSLMALSFPSRPRFTQAHAQCVSVVAEPAGCSEPGWAFGVSESVGIVTIWVVGPVADPGRSADSPLSPLVLFSIA